MNIFKRNIYLKKTGIGSVNLWCGKHHYLEKQDKKCQIMKPKYIYDLINDETLIVFEEKNIIDLT